MELDTSIVAVSSAHGVSPRAIIRASGNALLDVLQQDGIVVHPKRCVPSRIKLPIGILPVLIMAHPSSSSYTGQDVVEIILPNNAHLIQSVMQRLIECCGGRQAEAGEFTARAFFNGKVSLSEAEGISATIAASNDAELRGAALLRNGALHTVVSELSNGLTRTLALVEAEIDFTDEEDVVAITDSDLTNAVESILSRLQSLIDNKISMASLHHLPKIVLAGKPNVGKSTLFNTLLGYKRVVVSEEVGTTRDAIAEPTTFGDKECLLFDIAGLEDVNDTLSQKAQIAANSMLKDADLILWCISADYSCTNEQTNTVTVRTKADLETCDGTRFQDQFSVSAVTGQGVDLLKEEIEKRLSTTPVPTIDALALLPRHEEHLRIALHEIREVRNVQNERELVAAHLRIALNEISAISGKVTPDDVIGEVFSAFCIGK